MYNEELKPSKDIEIKFHRLIFPSLNLEYVPLNGLYNPIDNQLSYESALINKFKNFDISSENNVNIENLLSINNNFGKIFINEYLEGLVILLNISDKEIIIKDINITIKLNNYNSENIDLPLDIELPNNSITIPPKREYIFKIKTKLDYASNYILDIKFHSKSSIYDQIYNKMKSKFSSKYISEKFSIVDGSVEFLLKKKFKFDVFNPFKINEIFHNYPENKYIIEIAIFNYTKTTITILDIFLTPKNKSTEKIPLVQNLEEIKCVKYSQNTNDSKYLTLQPEEQIIVLFEIDNSDLFTEEEKFILYISWLNISDFNPKSYNYEFNNNFSTYNEYYKIRIKEKPNGDIILNQKFKIIINIERKLSNQNFNINISKEPNKSKEIKIIEIIEKNIKLSAKDPSQSITLICKSDSKGIVNLPKLKVTLYDEIKNVLIDNFYEALTCFNCVEKD